MSGADGQPYRCPTPCDEDCEVNGWGCHERHAYDKDHDPEACEARMLEASLRWLLGAGHDVQLGNCDDGSYARLLGNGPAFLAEFTAPPLGEALAQAVEWSEREGITP